MSDSPEKVCILWNDFESNMSSAFQELREDNVFFDVTLACEDKQVQAHKVILSACSSFFCNLLRRNPHSHPLIYLKGIKFSNLLSILDFMYQGQVEVAQDEITNFFAVAMDLKVKNLTQDTSFNCDQSPTPPLHSPNNSLFHPLSQNNNPPTLNNNNTPPSVNNDIISCPTNNNITFLSPNRNTPTPEISPNDNDSSTTPKRVYSSPLQQVAQSNIIFTQQISEEEYNQVDKDPPNSMVTDLIKWESEGAEIGDNYYPMTNIKRLKEEDLKRNDPTVLEGYINKDSVQGYFICQKCGTRKKQKRQIYHHLETKHFRGQYIYDCHLCDKTFNGRMTYSFHMSKFHKSQKSKYFRTM